MKQEALVSACRHRITKQLAVALMVAAGLPALVAHADPVAATTAQDPVPCAIVEKFAGEAFVLDPSRSHVDDVREKRPIACDGWLSTADAWVEIRHRNGHLIRVSRNSFVQLQTGESDASIFRGVLQAQAFGDSKPFVAWSPNARATLKFGSALMIYNPDKQSTQWVVLERIGSLENRFEKGTEVTVHEGESSILDLSKPRIVPQPPKAITVASLKPILKDLAVAEKKFNRAIRVALERQRRVFPAHVSPGIEASEASRAPASIDEQDGDYRRHPRDQETVRIEKAFRRKVLQGTEGIGTRLQDIAEAEALERKLARKAELEREQRREDLMKELGRIPASQ
jgi:hypothetical protein